MNFKNMNSDERKDWIETFVGGTFGVIAIIATIVEYALGDSGAIAGMFKDIFGTLVVVVLLFAAMPKRKNFNFEEKLTAALDEWATANSNMIVRNDAMDGQGKNDSEASWYGMGMKTDMNDFYRDVSTTRQVGWFVRLPVIKEENYNKKNIRINFHLNKETFFGRGTELTEDELKTQYDKLSNLFARFISSKFDGYASAAGKYDTLIVEIKHPIKTEEDIERLIDIINTAYTAYLVSSHIKLQ